MRVRFVQVWRDAPRRDGQAFSSFTFNPNDLYLIVLFEFIGNILAVRFF